MSFNTKFSMWWGSVTTKTERLFNKEKGRLVTHEYYDNPHAKSTRPKSMHSIRGSMRVQSAAASEQNSEEDVDHRQRSTSKRSAQRRQENRDQPGDDVQDMQQEAYQGRPQNPYNGNVGHAQQNPQYMQQQQMEGGVPYQQPYAQDQVYMQPQMMQDYNNQGYAN